MAFANPKPTKDPFEELEELVDIPASEISKKLEISEEAANHLLDALDEYLGEEGNGEAEEL